MNHTNNKEVQERFYKQILLPQIKGWGIHPDQVKAIYDFLHQELQKAREEERERAIEIIKDELRTSPIEVQMTKGIVFASIVGRIQSELDQPIINN